MACDEKEHNQTSRRNFFKKAAVMGLGAVLGSAAPRQPGKALAQNVLPKGPIPRRAFGRSGIKVSSLSLGGMFDIINNRLMLAKALDWGIDYWDTAEMYGGGRSEEGMGRWFARNPATRKQVFLVTKISPRRGADFTPQLEACLKRLHTDYVDLFFVHGISSIDEITPELKAWSREMKKAGKVRLFGFSTHANMEACLEGAARLSWIDGIMFTYNYRLMHEPRMKAAVEACYKAGIGLTAMKTQGGGPVKRDTEAELQMAGRFMEKGFTDHQAKLMAVLEDKRIASICSQMPNLTILGANAAAAGSHTGLSAEDRDRLARYAKETCSDYCAGCSRFCSEALGKEVPINRVMRCLMYYHSYQDPALAHSTFQTLPAETRAHLTRMDFREAENACPRDLPIGKLVREAADLLA